MRGLFTRDRSPHLDPPLPLTKIFFQVLEQNMKQENNNFILVKETFEESESMNVMTVESRVKLRRKVDDLNDRWQEMWRSHEVNKQR